MEQLRIVRGRPNFPPRNVGINGGGEKIQPWAETNEKRNTTDPIMPGEPTPASWRDSQLF